MRLTIIGAKELAASDFFTRSSDPYAVVLLCVGGDARRILKTKKVKRCLAPTWNETVTIDDALLLLGAEKTEILIEVFDYDRFKRDDFLGRARLSVAGRSGRVEEWLQLYDRSGEVQTRGSVHVVAEFPEAAAAPAAPAAVVAPQQPSFETPSEPPPPYFERAAVEPQQQHQPPVPDTPTAAPEERFVSAAAHGDFATVEQLIDQVDVDSMFENKTALIHACWRGDLRMVQLLVKHGCNVEHPNKFKSTPLLLAAANGHMDVVRFLVEEAHARIDTPGQNNLTAEEAARVQGHPEVAEYLASKKAPTPTAGPGGSFVSAAAHGDFATVEQLIDQVDVDSMFENKTALIHACWRGDLRMVQLLVKHGCNVEHPNKFKSTPLLLAAANGHMDVVRFLVEEAHARIDTPGQNNLTAEEAARLQGHPEVAEYLASKKAPTPTAPRISESTEAFNRAAAGDLFECPICLEKKPDSEIETTACRHSFCGKCLAEAKKIQPFCPLCRAPIGDVPSGVQPPSAAEWNVGVARARLSAPDAEGMRTVELLAADGTVEETNVHISTNAHIEISQGAHIEINGRVIENPQQCAQQ